MRTFLTIAALLACAAAWLVLHQGRSELATDHAILEANRRELLTLEAQRRQLQALQPSAAELAELNALGDERRRLQRALADRKSESAALAAPMSIGSWRDAADWKPRGSVSVRDSVESTLAAAAAGDLASLQGLLELAPDTRQKAEALLARLPPESRRTFTSAEQLVAAFTAKSIPVSAAQLVWTREHDADAASACLFLREPRPVSAGASSPPASPDPAATRMVFLSFQRSAAGWRLQVPVTAIDRIAQELTGASSR